MTGSGEKQLELHRVSVLSGRFSFEQPAMMRPRARLYVDRLELSGLTLRGRFKRIIPVESILHVDADGDSRLILWVSSGPAIRLRLPKAPTWKRTIDRLRPSYVP